MNALRTFLLFGYLMLLVCVGCLCYYIPQSLDNAAYMRAVQERINSEDPRASFVRSLPVFVILERNYEVKEEPRISLMFCLNARVRVGHREFRTASRLIVNDQVVEYRTADLKHVWYAEGWTRGRVDAQIALIRGCHTVTFWNFIPEKQQ